MTSKFLFSVVCLSVIAAGCKKNDEGASATSGAFLKLSDFPPQASRSSQARRL